MSADPLASPELRFSLDCCFAAHQANRPEVAGAFARAAEAVLKSTLPHVADGIARAASRKGRGDVIGARLVEHLDPASAAGVALVLMLRGARKPVVDALTSAFGGHPEFMATIETLCGRVFEPATSTISPDVTCAAPIEVAAPIGR